jgi:hypothetical protein
MMAPLVNGPRAQLIVILHMFAVQPADFRGLSVAGELRMQLPHLAPSAPSMKLIGKCYTFNI